MKVYDTTKVNCNSIFAIFYRGFSEKNLNNINATFLLLTLSNGLKKFKVFPFSKKNKLQDALLLNQYDVLYEIPYKGKLYPCLPTKKKMEANILELYLHESYVF